MQDNMRVEVKNILEKWKMGVEEMDAARKEREKEAEKDYKRRMLWWHIQMVLSLSYQCKRLINKLRTYR